MAVNIASNRINVPSGAPGKLATRRQPADDRRAERPPARAYLNHIPDDESIFTLVRSAVAALKRGVVWDRGSILNILT